MANPKEIRVAINRELENINSLNQLIKNIDLNNIDENIKRYNNEKSSISKWKNEIKELLIKTNDGKKLQKVTGIINPLIEKLNNLLDKEFYLSDSKSINDFKRINSNAMSLRRLINSLYNSNEKYLFFTNIKSQLQDVLKESQNLRKEVSIWEKLKLSNRKPKRIIFKNRVNKIKNIKGQKLPKMIVKNLDEYLNGTYEKVLSSKNVINQYSNNYHIPNLEIKMTSANKEAIHLEREILKLSQSVNSKIFGTQRNSKFGAKVIEELKEKIKLARKAILSGSTIKNSLKSLIVACNNFEDWINQSWIQFGGTPTGKVKSMGKRWAKEMGLR